MHIYNTINLPYSVKNMYQLVNNVKSYPAFLPGCYKTTILDSSKKYMIVSVDIMKFGIKKNFITYNKFVVNKKICIQLISGPFRKLYGKWDFIPITKNTCKVKFHIEFELINNIMQISSNIIFKNFTKNIIKAFITRAKKIYYVKN